MTPEDVRFLNRLAVKKYRASHRQAYNKRKREWHHSPAGQARQAAWYLRNKTRIQQQGKVIRAGLRAEMIAAYGSQCLCCGEKAPEFLTLDHIYGGGAAHRKSGSAYGVYQDLKKQNWPTDKYRLLCMNCNFAMRWGHGCPHQVASVKVI